MQGIIVENKSNTYAAPHNESSDHTEIPAHGYLPLFHIKPPLPLQNSFHSNLRIHTPSPAAPAALTKHPCSPQYLSLFFWRIAHLLFLE